MWEIFAGNTADGVEYDLFILQTGDCRAGEERQNSSFRKSEKEGSAAGTAGAENVAQSGG